MDFKSFFSKKYQPKKPPETPTDTTPAGLSQEDYSALYKKVESLFDGDKDAAEQAMPMFEKLYYQTEVGNQVMELFEAKQEAFNRVYEHSSFYQESSGGAGEEEVSFNKDAKNQDDNNTQVSALEIINQKYKSNVGE